MSLAHTRFNRFLLTKSCFRRQVCHMYYCAHLPVPSRTSSSVSDFRATECEGPTVEAMTTIIAVALPSRSDIPTIGDRAFPVAAT